MSGRDPKLSSAIVACWVSSWCSQLCSLAVWQPIYCEQAPSHWIITENSQPCRKLSQDGFRNDSRQSLSCSIFKLQGSYTSCQTVYYPTRGCRTSWLGAVARLNDVEDGDVLWLVELLAAHVRWHHDVLGLQETPHHIQNCRLPHRIPCCCCCCHASILNYRTNAAIVSTLAHGLYFTTRYTCYASSSQQKDIAAPPLQSLPPTWPVRDYTSWYAGHGTKYLIMLMGEFVRGER